MKVLLWMALATALSFGVSRAHADVYAYTDEAGITYFSNVPANDRYELIARDSQYDSKPEFVVNPKMLEQSAVFNPIIEQAAAQSDVAANLLRAVIVVESGFDARAESHKGAQGLMQLMPATARQYGVSDPFDPVQNISAGATYLRYLIDLFDDDLELALAAYNAGETAVNRYGGEIPPFKETRRYVPKVLQIYEKLAALENRT